MIASSRRAWWELILLSLPALAVRDLEEAKRAGEVRRGSVEASLGALRAQIAEQSLANTELAKKVQPVPCCAECASISSSLCSRVGCHRSERQ
jgi:hypothetical protein